MEVGRDEEGNRCRVVMRIDVLETWVKRR